MDEIARRYAREIFGGLVPVGRLFGMPVFVDERMPPDEIKFVCPVTRKKTIVKLP